MSTDDLIGLLPADEQPAAKCAIEQAKEMGWRRLRFFTEEGAMRRTFPDEPRRLANLIANDGNDRIRIGTTMTCPDCKGTGFVTLFTSREPCKRCAFIVLPVSPFTLSDVEAFAGTVNAWKWTGNGVANVRVFEVTGIGGHGEAVCTVLHAECDKL